MRKTKERKSKAGCTAPDGGIFSNSSLKKTEESTVYRGRQHVKGFLQCDKTGTEGLSRVPGAGCNRELQNEIK